MALNALLKTKERHSHRQWILNWLEDNYECKKGSTICKAAVFSDYAEVCRLQTLKPVTNSLFGKLVKAVFPVIRTCRKGPRSDSRTHYAGLHRRRDTISLPRVCPETGDILPHEEGASGVMSFIPAPSSSSSSSGLVESIPLHSDCSLTSSSPSSPTVSLEMSPVTSIVEASGSLPAFHFGQQQQHHSLGDLHCSQFVDSVSFGLQQQQQSQQQSQQQNHSDQLAAVSHRLSFYSPAHSLSSCSSGASTYDDALSEFEEMDLGDAPSLSFGGGADEFHDFGQLPMPMAPPCLCPSCGDADSGSSDRHHSYGSSSLEAVDDVLGDLEPHLLNLDPSVLHHLTSAPSSASAADHHHHHGQNNAFGFGSPAEECCGYGQVPAVPMASSMMAPPVAPSPPASPPPPLALMASPEFGGGAVHHPSHTTSNNNNNNNSRLRPFLRRTMAMAAAKTSAQAAEGNPLAEGLMGVISTCQKIIKDRAQKRRRKSVGEHHPHNHHHHQLHHQNVKHEPHPQLQQQQQQHVVKGEHAMQPVVVVDANALVPPFVLSLEEIPGSQASFGFQESVLVFANEYRKMYQAVFDRLVRFEYAILFDVVFSFWNQVKLQPNFSFLLDHEPVRKQLLAYDKKVLHTFKDYFSMNPLKMSAQQFGGFLQTIAFHLPFSAERATLPLLPTDLFDEKMRLLQTFAADLQGQAQSFTLPHVSLQQQRQQQQPQQQHTIMEINNY